MPKKIDHRKARAELAKLAPETLRAITVRLPAGLLVKVHEWAEQKGQDLAAAMRELMTLGLEAATSPVLKNVDRAAVKRWQKSVEQALGDGKSPIEPFLRQENPSLEALPVILAKIDYWPIYQRLLKSRGEKEPWVERIWELEKARAPRRVQPLMDALDNLEKRFLARRRLYSQEEESDVLQWLLSDTTMQQLVEESPGRDADVENVRQLIAARYLVARYPNQPWVFDWDQ
jgi:hypothetical protein